MNLSENTQPWADVAVVVGVKENCVQCKQTVKILQRHGVAYQALDLDTEPGRWLLEFAREQGISSAPVVKVNGIDGEAWGGFNKAKLQKLVEKLGRDLKNLFP
ncbi:MAG: glutaredoxin domain-containing protein [Arcanobacterium sp.]|nr:glutaredoxin domain-containing protein [Arcanobacterium sp.]